tara:strand:+ start:38 stop:619 length:582 start_codon:yes stop_codon:yes gene_type:complete
MATLFVDKLDPQSGTSLEIGSSGDTITIPSGATITNNGTQTGFGGANTPAFQAYASSDQSQTNDTFTKIQCNTEDFDVGGNYDHSTNYRFTPTTSGKYCIYGQAHCNAGSGNLTRLTVAIYKNGTDVAKTDYFLKTSSQTWTELTGVTQTIEAANGSSDYFELYARLRTYTGGGVDIEGGAGKSFFGAYKIIE